MFYQIAMLISMICAFCSCSKDDVASTTSTDVVVNVDATKFLTSTGSVIITTEDHAPFKRNNRCLLQNCIKK